MPLLRRDVPVIVDHDDDDVIGRVLEFYDADDAAGGRWRWARCEITSPPAWLRMNGGVSFGYASLQKQDMGAWSRVLRAPILELSLLSPSRQPAEPRARVAWIGPEDSPMERTSAGEEVLHLPAGQLLRRPNVGRVLGVR